MVMHILCLLFNALPVVPSGLLMFGPFLFRTYSEWPTKLLAGVTAGFPSKKLHILIFSSYLCLV